MSDWHIITNYLYFQIHKPVEHRGDTSLGDRYRLLLHGLMDRYSVLLPHLIKLLKKIQIDRKLSIQGIRGHVIHEHYSTVHYTAAQYSTAQYSTVQYSTLQYITVQYTAAQNSTQQYGTVQYTAAQYSAVRYSTLQYLVYAYHSSICKNHGPTLQVKLTFRILYHRGGQTWKETKNTQIWENNFTLQEYLMSKQINEDEENFLSIWIILIKITTQWLYAIKVIMSCAVFLLVSHTSGTGSLSTGVHPDRSHSLYELQKLWV